MNNPNQPYIVPLIPEDNSFSIANWQQIIYRRWKPALAVTILSFSGLFAMEALKTPKYRSETVLLLESLKNQESSSVSPDRQTVFSKLYNVKDLSTEIFILRSYELIEKAVTVLRSDYFDISVSEIFENLAIDQAAVKNVPTDVLVISYIDKNPEKAKRILEVLGDTYINYSLERKRSQASNAIKFIEEAMPEAQKELNSSSSEINSFRQKNGLVNPDEYAGDITGYKQSVEVQEKELTISLSRARALERELNKQLAELGQDPETLFASSTLSQDTEYQNLSSQLADLKVERVMGKVNFKDTYHAIEDLDSRIKELQQLLQQRARQILGNSVSPRILNRVVIAQTRNISTTTDGVSTTTTPGQNTILTELANQLLKVRNEIVTLQSQLNSTRNLKAQTANKFRVVPGLQQNYIELEREYERKSKKVDYLMQRKQELEISEAEANPPWRILNEAYLPTKPISPNIQQALIRSLVVGGLLGIAVAILLQQLDQKVKKVEEAKSVTGLDLLGTIPKVDEPRVEINPDIESSNSYYYSIFTEGMRALAVNLRYIVIETGKIKTIAITSSTSSEGKTTISYNLGVVLAELGHSVLVVDCDLRKPKLHKVSQLSNKTGLSDLITSDQPWIDYRHREVIPHLDVITAGSASPNPIGLLDSNKMEQLLEGWKKQYDYVLIDTPPIGVVADAKSIANRVDTFLFVTAIDRVTRKEIQNSLEILSNSNCHIAGFVANMVERDSDAYYSSYYNTPIDRNEEVEVISP